MSRTLTVLLLAAVALSAGCHSHSAYHRRPFFRHKHQHGACCEPVTACCYGSAGSAPVVPAHPPMPPVPPMPAGPHVR